MSFVQHCSAAALLRQVVATAFTRSLQLQERSFSSWFLRNCARVVVLRAVHAPEPFNLAKLVTNPHLPDEYAWSGGRTVRQLISNNNKQVRANAPPEVVRYMTENLKEHVIATVKSLMKPIIKLLLRNGVTYKEFALLCKSIYVEAAAEGFGIRGRPTNVSRISVLTGIDRKEVKRIKDLLQENRLAVEAQSHQDRITRLLTAWHQDPEYSCAGQVKVLPIEGGCGSFTSLVRRYGGDVPVQALLKELLRVGVAAKVEDGRIKVLSRYFMPVQTDPQALLRAGSMISELGENLFHNLYVVSGSANNGRLRTRFDGRASNNLIDAKHHLAFQQFLECEGQAFLERVDAWLSEHELCDEAAKARDAAPMRLGVGVFGIEKRIGNPGE